MRGHGYTVTLMNYRPFNRKTTMNLQYNSADDDKIYQTNPRFRKPSKFQPKGWTDTVEGYINEANRLARCIIRNRTQMDRPYAWGRPYQPQH